MDFYPANSDGPSPLYIYIHGGGFRSGDKANISQTLLSAFLSKGVSVASVNYRLSDVAPFPAAMLDSARAVQFLRTKAGEWSLEPARFAAGGGSAGAGISMWIGFRQNMARSGSADAVERQSTELTCIGCWQAQCSYDPNFISSIIPGDAATHPGVLQYLRATPDTLKDPEAMKRFHDASPINFVDSDSPPVFIWYKTPNFPLDKPLARGPGIHHPKFGSVLKEKMDDLGVECVIRLREEWGDASDSEVSEGFDRELAAWVSAKLSR
jgi:acetyl esterase/lipase